MSKWSDGAELLQKIMTAKEVIPIQGDLINLQQTMFSLQSEQMKLLDENSQLKAQISKLEKKNSYALEENHTWYVMNDRPDVKLCPVCLNHDGFESPTVPNENQQYCNVCRGVFK